MMSITSGAGGGILQPSPMIEKQARQPSPSLVFSGRVEVIRADNGYIVQVGTKEGYEPRTFIAKDAEEVNTIITTEIVKFRLAQS